MTASQKPRIAFWFRYGPAAHAELFHAIPDILADLSNHAEIHYFSFKTHQPVPDHIQRHAILHTLPFYIDRTNQRDKFWKTLCWITAIPWLAIYCRFKGIRAVYIDETIPLTAPLARLFFGRHVAMTIADFFVDMYAERYSALRIAGKLVKRMDLWAWRTLPLLFTRAKYTKDYLTSQGVRPDRIEPVYDPCDLTIYHPADRATARAKWDIDPDSVVLVHHGILHPNKGNDRILRALAEHRTQFPNLMYLLIGDGPDMSRLKRLTTELGIESQVRFTGWLKTLPEVNTALNAGDIGLVMRIGQLSDNFHMTGALVHAMACGLPILAARLGGISEVVKEGHNGHLFDPHTLSDFSDQLKLLYNAPELRSRLGQQAYEDAKHHFDIKTVTQQTVDPLLKLIR